MGSKTAIRGLAAALLFACGCAAASGLQVAPIGLEFTPASPAQGLWLTNTGDKALHAQARVYQWTQVGGKDALAPTRSMLASPPMLSLDPGGRQLVRVIRTGGLAVANAGEEAFRVLIDELPQADQRQSSSVEYVLRYSVPVFVESAASSTATAASGTLHAMFDHGAGGLSLAVRNDASKHAQLSNVSLLTADGRTIVLSDGLLGYVLPGMTMRWPLKLQADAVGTGMQLKARINGEPIEQAIPVGDLPR
jgi:fimbrial chaperone protein